MAQWLEHWSCIGATRDQFPAKAQEIFQLCFSLLRLSSRKMGARPGLDICLPITDDFFEEGECYGPGTLTYISTLGRFRIASSI